MRYGLQPINKLLQLELRLAAFPLCAILIYLFSVWSGYADDTRNGEIDFVTFFKQAISSPPDVEKYVVKRTNLQVPTQGTLNLSPFISTSPQYYEGALSGTNFYLHFLPDPDLPADSNHLGTISARSGSSNYEMGGHGITFGIGENSLTAGVEASFHMTRGFLCMGVGALEPKTVKWNGKEFTAKNFLGKDVHGSLQVSNNLPLRMEVTLAGEPRPYMAIEYKYATPADSFAGYPEKYLISYRSGGGLKPLAEVEFKSVLLATQQLSAAFFNQTRFPNLITYTNVYSNSDFYSTDAKNKQLTLSNPVLKSGGFTNSHSRTGIYFCLVIVTLIPVVTLIMRSVQQKQKKTN